MKTKLLCFIIFNLLISYNGFSQIEEITQEFNKPTRILLDGNNLYVTNWASDRISKIDLTDNSISDYTLIPDKEFEQALIDLGHDSGAIDGKVLTSNINTITTLSLANKNIKYLNGIEDFVALTELNFSDNKVSYVDFSKNTSLIYLECRNNSISDLNLKHNLNLKRVDCSRNYGIKIDLPISDNLEEFEGSYNYVEELDFSNNPNLKKIRCTFSYFLTNLNVKNGLALEHIDCGYSSKLSSLDITDNINLNYLRTTYTKVSSLNLNNNTKLETLYSTGTGLTSLNISNCPDLEVVFVDGNPSLTTVDTSNNINLKRFYYAGFSGNGIANLDLSNNIKLENLIVTGANLTSLDLSKNTLLKKLDIFYNFIASLDVSKNINLTELSCNNNNLDELNLKNGNNTSLTVSAFNNPNLTCVQVDDSTYSNENWTGFDSQSVFSENCSTASINDYEISSKISLYPNPISQTFFIKSPFVIQKIKIYDIRGSFVKIIENHKKGINISDLSSGIYFLKIKTEKAVGIKRIIKN